MLFAQMLMFTYFLIKMLSYFEIRTHVLIKLMNSLLTSRHGSANPGSDCYYMYKAQFSFSLVGKGGYKTIYFNGKIHWNIDNLFQILAVSYGSVNQRPMGHIAHLILKIIIIH